MSKFEKEKIKLVQEKCQSMLNEMLRDDDNKYCVDCDSKGPRWASWNLGIFLCIRCAGIHRNLGVHISKVKSVNLDSWTPEQVVTMQQMGNSRARAVYEANIPDNFRRPTALENFIRAKYEHKKYIAQEYVPISVGKVNWDAEIEESIKRKKESKRSESTIGPLPSIPKKLATNSNNAPVPAKKKEEVPPPAKEVNTNSISDDLLGLSSGSGLNDLTPGATTDSGSSTGPAGADLLSPPDGKDVLFGGDPFASPIKGGGGGGTSNADELGSIFLSGDGGGTGESLMSKMMSKESILSLYGQASSSPINPFGNPNMFANQMNQNPGGVGFPQGQQPQQTQQQPQGNLFNPLMMGQQQQQPPTQQINNNDPLKMFGGFDIQQGLQGLNMGNSFTPQTQQPVGGGGGAPLMGNYAAFGGLGGGLSTNNGSLNSPNLMMGGLPSGFAPSPNVGMVNSASFPPNSFYAASPQPSQPPPPPTSGNINQFSNGGLSNLAWK